ncbi:hypothetical protein ACIP5Y_24730 [Nocardia sp. NPDC088792]|uniref:hypothetical protein n=1 Tax=Nocardia sp. NPDC088792 TaxID=3364332 RepID=UPI0038204C1A
MHIAVTPALEEWQRREAHRSDRTVGTAGLEDQRAQDFRLPAARHIADAAPSIGVGPASWRMWK